LFSALVAFASARFAFESAAAALPESPEIFVASARALGALADFFAAAVASESTPP
jgi:hypothetical protein